MRVRNACNNQNRRIRLNHEFVGLTLEVDNGE